MSLICEICESVYENENLVNCKICGAILNKKIHENEKVTDTIAEDECFDDFDNLEELFDIKDIELFDITDNCEEYSNDYKVVLAQLLKDEKHGTNYHEEDYFQYESYTEAIKKFKIYLNKLTYTIFDYHIVNPKYLLARIIPMLKKVCKMVF